jgi:hypothetical protein
LSKAISRSARRGLLAAFSLALLAGSFALTPAPVEATSPCSGPGTVTLYYNSHGKEVGRYIQNCNSEVCTGSGAVTSNSTVLFLPCAPQDPVE